jgi:Cof subfamily protein (haloacid dehalogenase superfamily)
MTYRLLALDLDGTLLRADHSVDPRDVAAIAELAASGVTVTIVTGRLRTGSLAAARAVGITGAIACVEGSHIVDVDGGVTHAHHAIAPPIAEALRGIVAQNGLAGFVFDAAGIHHDHAAAPYAEYVSTWSPNMRIVEEELAWQTEPLAAVAVGTPDAVAAAHAALRERAADLFSVSFGVRQHPGHHAVLVRAAGPTKGTALAELCRAIGCTPAEAVAVGDWVNDVPMFEVAGRSFAMGGTPEHVSSKATDQLRAEAGMGGGIAEAIRRAWG